MDSIVYINDPIPNITILGCRDCGEMFSVSNMEAYNNGIDWVLNEWEFSLASQRRLCGEGVER
jgi:hypothetical protein